MGVKYLQDDLRRAFPALARKADTGRVGAIHLMCLECQGGDPNFPGEVHAAKLAIRDCPTGKCPLYRWRPYQRFRTAGKGGSPAAGVSDQGPDQSRPVKPRSRP